MYKKKTIMQYLFWLSGSSEKMMSTCPGLNLVQSIFSYLVSLTNPDVNLSCAKFSSSLVDIKICHYKWKQVSAIRRSLL